MPIIVVPAEACESGDYERLVPGSRVEYRGIPWKVVGMYFAPCPGSSGDGHRVVPPAPERTKHLILQSLDLPQDALQYAGPSSAP